MSRIGIGSEPGLWFSYDTHHLHIRSHIYLHIYTNRHGRPTRSSRAGMGSLWQWDGYPSQDTFLGLQLAPLAWIDGLGGVFDLVRVSWSGFILHVMTLATFFIVQYAEI